jgi:hypothetical protein
MGPFRFLSYGLRITIQSTADLRLKLPVSSRRSATKPPVNEFQVDLHSGLSVLRQTDLFVPDLMPLVLTRTYRPWFLFTRAFGMRANHPYDICPTGTRFPYTYEDLNLEDDRRIYSPRISKGTGYADAVFRHSETSSEFFGAQDAWNGNGWTLDFPDPQVSVPGVIQRKKFRAGRGDGYERQRGPPHSFEPGRGA